MIFPRFTIRWLLVLTAIVGLLSLVGTSAYRAVWTYIERQDNAGLRRMVLDDPDAVSGAQLWSVGVMGAVLVLGVMFSLYALVFLVGALGARLEETLRAPRIPTTPFATAQPPPQILPPREPEST